MEQNVDKNSVIKDKLSSFELHINSYRDSLNSEGVWLFLATLGCWSVNGFWYQIAALMITFFLFSHRIYARLEDKRLFPTIIKELAADINELPDGDTKKARIYDLDQIRNVKLGVLNHFKATGIFIVCYSFLGLTLWHSWSDLIKK